jgi:hypothetical protein
MNDVIGIDPKAPSGLRDLSDLLRLFGPSEGRFIADFPMEWRSELRDHLRSLSDLGLVVADEAIKNRLAHAVLPTNVRFRSGMSWPENAVSLRSSVFKLIGPAGMPGNVVEPIDQVLSGLDSFPDASGALLDRTPEAYVTAARPMLMLSRKIVLVDPFFTLKFQSDSRGAWLPDRRRKVLVQMMLEAIKWKQVEAFEIYYSPTKTGRTLTSQSDDFESLANEVGAMRVATKVHSLDRDGSDKQHGRYLLGLRNGLHFDHGFDVANDGSKNHVEWLSKGVLKSLLDKFT